MDVKRIAEPFVRYYEEGNFCYCNCSASEEYLRFSWDEEFYGHIILEFDFKDDTYKVSCIMPPEDYCNIYNITIKELDREKLSEWNKDLEFPDPYRAFDEFNRLISQINELTNGKLSEEVIKLIHTNIT